jgi:hypothetical protein
MKEHDLPMGRSSRASFAFVLGLGSSLAACDRAPPARDGLSGWPPGDPVEVGACRFLLSQANLWHSTEWHLEVKLSAEGIGAEAAHCGYSVQAVTLHGSVLTGAATGRSKLGPGEVREHLALAREANETGTSSGSAEGAWVYVELSEGRWPMATSKGVHVSPDRVRPP